MDDVFSRGCAGKDSNKEDEEGSGKVAHADEQNNGDREPKKRKERRFGFLILYGKHIQKKLNFLFYRVFQHGFV